MLIKRCQLGRRKKYKNVNAVKDILDRMLGTLESRREQISTRSTVSLAASSGLLVLGVQFIFDICEMDDYKKYGYVVFCLIICIIMSALSIITSLDLIKRISRKKHIGKNQNASDPNILYFGWISKQSEDELNKQLLLLTLRKQVEFEIRQAISLSKNLKYRYKQLKKTYSLFVIGLIAYICSILFFIISKYDIITKLGEIGGKLCK